MSDFLKKSFFEPGVYTVIPTIFNNDKVCIKSIKNLISYQIENNVKNIVLLGTTSEAPVLSDDEKELIVRTIWDNYSDRLNIIVGIGGNNTKNVIELGTKLRNYCNGFLLTVPNYNKPTQLGVFKHFSVIAKELSEKPLMLYNIPSRCGINMEPEIIAKLYQENDNIMAIKEASGSMSQILSIKALCDILIYSGDDSLILPTLSAGGVGVVSVASNLIPKQILEIVNYCLIEDYKTARHIFYKYYGLLKLLFLETNPVPLKYLLFKNKMVSSNEVRLPLVDLKEESKIKLDIIFEVLLNNNKKIYKT